MSSFITTAGSFVVLERFEATAFQLDSSLISSRLRRSRSQTASPQRKAHAGRKTPADKLHEKAVFVELIPYYLGIAKEKSQLEKVVVYAK